MLYYLLSPSIQEIFSNLSTKAREYHIRRSNCPLAHMSLHHVAKVFEILAIVPISFVLPLAASSLQNQRVIRVDLDICCMKATYFLRLPCLLFSFRHIDPAQKSNLVLVQCSSHFMPMLANCCMRSATVPEWQISSYVEFADDCPTKAQITPPGANAKIARDAAPIRAGLTSFRSTFARELSMRQRIRITLTEPSNLLGCGAVSLALPRRGNVKKSKMGSTSSTAVCNISAASLQCIKRVSSPRLRAPNDSPASKLRLLGHSESSTAPKAVGWGAGQTAYISTESFISSNTS
jgi:hypothetical protein